MLLLEQKHFVEFDKAIAHAFEPEILLGELVRVIAELFPQRGIRKNPLDGIGKPTFVCCGNQRSAFGVHQFRIASDIVSNHRNASSHRLENYVRKSFGVRSEHSHVHRCQQSRNIAPVAEEKYPLSKTESLRFTLNFWPKRTIANQQEFDIWQMLMNARRDPQ